MINSRHFSDLQNVIDFDALQEWCENYFQNVMSFVTAFTGRMKPEEAIARINEIPIDEMVAEVLENELEAVRTKAAETLRALLTEELESYRAYAASPGGQ